MPPAKYVGQGNCDDSIGRQYAVGIVKDSSWSAQVFEYVREDDQIVVAANCGRDAYFQVRDMNRLADLGRLVPLIGADGDAVNLPSAGRKDSRVIASAASAIKSAARPLRADEFQQSEIPVVLIGASCALAMASR
jgi:hypothetical protein